MAKLPEPPSVADLIAIGPEIVRLPEGTAMARLFFRGGAHPVSWDAFRFWGPGSSRFDHHLPGAKGEARVQDRGILYAAGDGEPSALAVCIAEVFQATRSIDLHDRTPWFATFRTARELALLDLRRLWPTRAGASAAIASGPKARARRWSQRIYDAYPEIDGLLYPSSMGGNADAVALYERARDALPAAPAFHRPLADPSLRAPLFAAARAIRYAIV
jgi:hypothetical protein